MGELREFGLVIGGKTYDPVTDIKIMQDGSLVIDMGTHQFSHTLSEFQNAEWYELVIHNDGSFDREWISDD